MIGDEWQLDQTPTLSDDALSALMQHEFAGNVRELRNILERAITLADTPVIETVHLGLTSPKPQSNHKAPSTPYNADEQHLASVGASPYRGQQHSAAIQAASAGRYGTAAHQPPAHTADEHKTPSPTRENLAIPPSETNTSTQTDSHNRADHTGDDHNADTDNHTAALPKQGLEAYLQEQERQLIISALQQTDGNKTQAAELLGTSFRSLRYRMKKLGIDESGL